MTKVTMDTQLEANFKNGWWFFFEVDGHQVTHHSSSLTGRERIWVNDDLVVNRIGWGIFNTHSFKVGSRDAKICTGFKQPLHIFTSRVDVELYLDGVLQERVFKQFVAGKKLAWEFMIGACAGIAIGFFLRSILGG